MRRSIEPTAYLEKAPVKAAVFAIAMGIVLIPLTVGLVPPLVDYPNHLAKAYLAVNLPENAQLAEFYEWRLRFVPNLAQDFFMPPLAKLFGVYDAGRLFLAWSLIQIFLGVCLLRYAVQGRVGYLPLLAILFLYNKVVWWGLLNYLFTSGLILILFAVWILMARRNPLLRSAVFAALLSGMFFFHFIATVVLCLCIATYEAAQIWFARDPHLKYRDQWLTVFKQGLVTAAPFFPVLVLWSLSPTGANEVLFEHAGFLNVVDAVLSPFMLKGTQLDFVIAVFVLFFAASAFVLGQFVLARSLVLPCLCLLFVAMLMPATVLGVFGTHYRIPYLLGCIVVAGIQIRNPRKVLSTVALLTVGALFVVRGAYVTAEWRRFDTQVQQYLSAIATIEPGSKVVTALDPQELDEWTTGTLSRRIFWHLSTLVVIEASAFDPLLFSDPIRQSIAVRDGVKRIDATIGQPAPTKWFTVAYEAASAPNGGEARKLRPDDPWANWAMWHKDFDYLIRFSFGSPRDELSGPLTHLQSGDWFDLYKINKPGKNSP